MSKEVEEKISFVREMCAKYKIWADCSKNTMAEINRAYSDAISALVLFDPRFGRISAEKWIIDRLGDCLVSFSVVTETHPVVTMMALKIAITWRWECAADSKEKADAFKHHRLQLCAAANMPLWMGALYASEMVSKFTSTRPTDF
jgi:hypothetical protein